MKSKLLKLLLVALFPLTAFGQKLQKPIIDKLTGDTTWSTSKEKLYLHGNYLTGQGEGVVCFLRSVKGAKGLILNIQTTNQKDYPTMITGRKAHLKLADGSIVVLICAANNFNMSGSELAVAGSSFGWFDLTPADIEKLSTQNLTFLRIETSSGDFDCEIKPKNAEMFKKQFPLISSLK